MPNNEATMPFQGTQKIKLSIKQVFGTSAKNANQFAIQGDLIAYTASGGVVVSKVDKENNKVISQRFFCANTNYSQSVRNDISSTDAYLNIAMNNRSNESIMEIRKDSYGYSLNAEPLAYYENNDNNISDFGLKSTSNNDAKLSSPSKLKDKVRSINCISLSPNKRILAVGEIGYQPRILLFSLAPDSNPWPIASISEHTFGINSICFSSDSKYFCSLGLVNDRFLNVWKLTPTSITLQASNKCSSIINQVLWHEDLIITIGLRLIKVWEVSGEDTPNNKPKVLKGKNVLLGPMINSNFIKADILNSDEALLVDDNSRLLLLKLNYMNLKLIPLESLGFKIYSIWIDHENDTVWFGSESNTIYSAKLDELKTDNCKILQTKNSSSPNKDNANKYCILSLSGFNNDNLIVLNYNEEITLVDKYKKTEQILTSSLTKNLSGIKHCFSNDVVVFSGSGKVRIISEDDTLKNVFDFNLPSTEVISNALTAVDMGNECLILGDKLGNLYILEVNEVAKNKYSLVYQTKAHSSSINEIAYFVFEKFKIIVSISRDRMIQIHYKEEDHWDILQTIPIHSANLLQVCYHKEKIYVSSADRSISIHKLALEEGNLKIYQEKIITLKSSPLYMSLFNDNLTVSTNDKNIIVFSTEENYEQKRSICSYNEKNNDTLQVEIFTILNSLLIASSSDKSLRVFNFFSGKELCVAWGQSEPILSLILKNDEELVSISNDGCLFRWNLYNQTNTESTRVENTIEVEENILPLYSKVTRKIVPTSPQKNPLNSPIKSTQALQINSNGSDQKEKYCSPLSTPTSPTPKLTAATLKRIEARNKANNVNVEIIKKQPSSPSKPLTPLKPLQRSLSSARKQSFVSKCPIVSPVSPSKPLLRKESECKSPSPERAYLRKESLGRSPSPIKNNEIDTYIKELDSIEGYIRNNIISAKDKSKLFLKVKIIMELLNPDEKLIDNISKMSLSDDFDISIDNTKTQLLENYSDKLIKLFEEKLHNYNFNSPETPSKMQK